MDKRQFLKWSPAFMWPAVWEAGSRACMAQGNAVNAPLTNWAGNLTYAAMQVEHPRNAAFQARLYTQ